MVDIDKSVESYLDEIDNSYSSKFGISISQFLRHPEQYTDNKEELLPKINSLVSYINDYFDKIMTSLSDEKNRFDSIVESIDTQTKTIMSKIGEYAEKNNIPIIFPNSINVSNNIREDIIIDKYDESIDTLIKKLVESSFYIADVSFSYNNYSIGNWFFSTDKRAYILAFNIPKSPVIDVENARAYLLSLVDNAKMVLSR